MDSKFLSGKELLEARLKASKPNKNLYNIKQDKLNIIPRAGSSKTQYESRLNDLLANRFNLINDKRAKLSNEIGEGEWLTDRSLVVYIKLKCKPHHMGFVENGKTFLYPEEALFLIQSEALYVYHNGLPLSIQTAYEIFFKTSHEIEKFFVYSNLVRQGIKLVKCTHLPTDTNTESSLPLSVGECMRKRKLHEHEKLLDIKKLKPGPLIDLSIHIKNFTHVLTPSLLRKGADDGTTPEAQAILNPANSHIKQLSSTWEEFERLQNQSGEGIYVDIEKVPVNEDFSSFLPNSCLNTSDLNYLINHCQPLSCKEIYKKLVDEGPNDFQDDVHGFQTEFDYSIIHSSKKAQFSNLKINNVNSKIPPLYEIISTENDLTYAITENDAVSFYKLTPFSCWDEIPQNWLGICD